MALQVWLPLNGDLRNQGLANVTVTNNGATVNSAGKIGSCYAFDGNDDYIAISGQQLFDCFKGGDTQFSLCMWIYNGESSGARGVLFGDHGTTGAVSINIELNGNAYNNSIRFYWTANPDWAASNSIITPNSWSHLAITYSGTDVKVYVNGVLKDTRSGSLATKSKTSGMFMLGRDYQTGETALNGRINDFRIYDHCLSPKEVKEISKGLVLHYKLDDPYVEPTINYGRMNETISLRSECVNDWKIEKLDRDTVKVTALKDSPAYAQYGDVTSSLGSYRMVAAGNPCTLSCEIVDYKGSLGRIYPASGGFGAITGYQTLMNRVARTIVHTVNWGHNIIIRTSSQSQIKAGDYIVVRNTQIEEKDHATPYTQSSRNQGVIYDCSGYNHNGLISGNTVSIESQSPRFNKCILSNNPSVYSILESPNLCLPDGPVTISFWSKPTIITSEDKSKIELRFSKFYYFTYVNYPYFVHDTEYHYRYINYWSDDLWHHVVCRYTGSVMELYIDGNLIPWTGTTTTTTDFWNELILKFRGNRLSDLRIYSTALSADDVKELYNTSAYIYNDGTVAAMEFDENNSESRELHPFSYTNGTSAIRLPNGDFQMKDRVWPSSDYIPINPVGKTYYYDVEYSNSGGGRLYIGFEKFDANKQSGANYECQYVVSTTGTYDHARVTGTINLSTANGNTAAYTRLRLLNNWDGGGTADTRIGTIHYVSLKEVATKTISDIKRTGVFSGDAFIESKDASISHTGNVIGREIIEI